MNGSSRRPSRHPGLLALAACLALLAGCVDQTVKSTSVPAVATAGKAVPETQLLDVGIAIFDTGLDDVDEDEQVYPEVRKAEAHFMPGLLSQAMQQSGAWGAVRVVPDPDRISDLSVHGKILHSDGERLDLAVTANDSSGKVWLDETYSGHASAYAYKAGTVNRYDPFQAIYNTIANDLLAKLEALPGKERENIRLTSEMLFAQQFSPDAFAGYLKEKPKGRYSLARLPAANDPMLERIGKIRDRDNLYVDTLQEYYTQFANQMYNPYQEWRGETYEASVALQETQRASRAKLLAGALAVAAGIAGMATVDSNDNHAGAQAAGSAVAVYAGGVLLKSGLEDRAEAQIHVAELEELGMSLEAEITPQVIELEDRSITLTGSVEDQYAQWRSLLADIYAAEVGALETPEAVSGSADKL